MYNQRNGGFRQGGRGGGERTWDRGADQDRPMFKATCASCGNGCEVPFKPNGSKPVYCRDCFKKEGGGDERPMRLDSRNDSRFETNDRPRFQATCGSCGDSCEVPFRPDGSRPIYCRNCFGKRDQGMAQKSSPMSSSNASQGGVDMRAEMKSLNSKLDRIMTALNITVAPKPAAPAPAPMAAPKAVKLEAPKPQAEIKPEVKVEDKIEKKAKAAKPAAKKAAPKKKR